MKVQSEITHEIVVEKEGWVYKPLQWVENLPCIVCSKSHQATVADQVRAQRWTTWWKQRCGGWSTARASSQSRSEVGATAHSFKHPGRRSSDQYQRASCLRFGIFQRVWGHLSTVASCSSRSKSQSTTACCSKTASWWAGWTTMPSGRGWSPGGSTTSLIRCVPWQPPRPVGCCYYNTGRSTMCFMLFLMTRLISCILNGWICMSGVGVHFLILMGKKTWNPDRRIVYAFEET